MPDGRTMDYAILRACERFNIRPPNVEPKWEDNTPMIQSLLIAFSQIRDVEEAELCVSRL